ncbi:glycoside hydrolase family 28 protein [Paenibacillus silvisoli]|uniref:glycoside hydrolase family 28 protein n=1 Tax=Paenibacillus silvisoli TaxID=3110539 RepID=UPI00280459DE|nr:glycosyl hydrolase family 28-related protein [Paenibacillus silvisoli]
MTTTMNASVYNVRDYGAVGDGETLDTAAINQAIADCNEQGGGTVWLPSGTYLSGTVFMRSHVTLHLDAGSVLLGSPDMADYPKLPYTSEFRNTALIASIGAKQIAITGSGVIDGNGDSFACLDQADLLRDFDASFTRQGSDYFRENDKADDGPVDMKERPGILVLILNSLDAQVSHVRIRNTPNWCIHVACTDGVLLTGLDIRNSLLIPNADGIDVSRSRNVRISDCNIEAGDDGLAFSPCAEGYGGSGCEHVVVQNCTIKSRSAGIRIGWDANGFRNFMFHNIVIRESNRGIGLFLRESESIENVVFSNIIIETRLHKGKWWGKAEPIHISAVKGFPHSGELGSVRNVTFTNITVKSEHGIVLYGSEERPIENVTFQHVRMLVKSGPLQESFGGNLDFRPALDDHLKVFSHDIPALYAKHVKGLAIHGFDLEWSDDLPDFVQNGLDIEAFEDVTIDGFKGRQPQLEGDGAAIRLANGRQATIRNSVAKAGTTRFGSFEGVEEAGLFLGNDLSRAAQPLHAEAYGFTVAGCREGGGGSV